MSFEEVVEQWALVEYTFTTIGVHLEEVWRRKSWRWFKTHIRGMLQSDTPLARYFAPKPDETEQEALDGYDDR